MSSRPDQGEIDALFERYRQTRRRRDRNALVEAHIGFANHLARRYSNRGLERQDLEQVALLALVKAVDRFYPGVGAAFTTFAGRMGAASSREMSGYVVSQPMSASVDTTRNERFMRGLLR